MRPGASILALVVLAGCAKHEQAPKEIVEDQSILDRPPTRRNVGTQLKVCYRLYHDKFAPGTEPVIASLHKKCDEVVLPQLLEFLRSELLPFTDIAGTDLYCNLGYHALELRPDPAQTKRFNEKCCHYANPIRNRPCLGRPRIDPATGKEDPESRYPDWFKEILRDGCAKC